MSFLRDLISLLHQYRKEITLIIVTGVTTFVFTKALPALLRGAKQCLALAFAICTGRGREYVFLRKYLKWLVNEHRYVPVLPSQVLDPERLPKMPELEAVYIRLQLKTSGGNPKELAPASLWLESARTVILGDPGAGKTTFLKYLCLTHARYGITSVIDLRSRRELKGRFGKRARRIPVFVNLNRLYRDSPERSGSLLAVARVSMPEPLRAKCPPTFFEKLSESGHALFLLDGLDEIATPELRLRAAEEIGALASAAHRDTAWIVTSRIFGYQPKLQDHQFRIATVQHLAQDQVQRFVEHWYSLKCEAAGYAGDELEYQRQRHAERAHRLNDVLASTPGLRTLATSPMLVSLIALLHSVRLELPENKAVLYRDCVELLADRWDVYRGLRQERGALQITTAQKVGFLTSLAHKMHAARHREILEGELEQLALQYLAGITSGVDARSSHEFIDTLQERSGLIISRGVSPSGERMLAFSHLSFQEYLVSRWLGELPAPDAQAFVLDHWTDSWWKEPILLYLAQAIFPLPLVGRLYARARADGSVDGLSFTGSCLAEVQADKTDPLYNEIVNDLAYIAFCGRFGTIVPERLRTDRQNLLLRWLVATCEDLFRTRSDAVQLVFRTRGQHQLEEDSLHKAVLGALTTKQTTWFDRDFVRFLFASPALGAEDAFRLAAKYPHLVQTAPAVLERKNQMKLGASLQEWDWRDILNLRVLAGSAALTGKLEGSIKAQQSWKHQMALGVVQGSGKGEHVHNTRGSAEPPRTARSLMETLEAANITAAATHIHTAIVRRDVLEVDVSRLVSLYFKTVDEDVRLLVICVALGLERRSDELTRLFIDFVTTFLRDAASARPERDPSRLGIRESLALRCLRRVKGQPGRADFVRMVFDCYSYRLSPFRQFALDTFLAIEELDDEAIQQCFTLAAGDDARLAWASVLALGGAKGRVTDAILERLLVQLYDRDYSYEGITIRAVAANSLLRLAS
jgi:hypothetical protein